MSSEAFPDLRQMTEQLSRLSIEAQRAREEFEAVEVHGGSPDGLVRATMRSGRLADLTIDPSAMDLEPAHLAEQVLAALRDCEERSTEMLSRSTSPMTGVLERLLTRMD